MIDPDPILSTTTSKIKALALLGWSAVVTVITLAMFVALSAQGPQPGQTIDQHHAAIGGAMIIVSGCAGGGWLCGLLVIVLVAAVLRP
jgi:uncharacterized membrane protein YjfL (UPF0719 family)